MPEGAGLPPSAECPGRPRSAGSWARSSHERQFHGRQRRASCSLPVPVPLDRLHMKRQRDIRALAAISVRGLPEDTQRVPNRFAAPEFARARSRACVDDCLRGRCITASSDALSATVTRSACVAWQCAPLCRSTDAKPQAFRLAWAIRRPLSTDPECMRSLVLETSGLRHCWHTIVSPNAPAPKTSLRVNTLDEAPDLPRPAIQDAQRARATSARGIDLDIWKMGGADVVEAIPLGWKRQGPSVHVADELTALSRLDALRHVFAGIQCVPGVQPGCRRKLTNDRGGNCEVGDSRNVAGWQGWVH